MKHKHPTMAEHADKMHPVAKKPFTPPPSAKKVGTPAPQAEAAAADQAAATNLAPAVLYNKTVAALRKAR